MCCGGFRRSSASRTRSGSLAVAVVAAAVVYSLIRVGPPSEERERRLDERRIEDLRSTARAIDLHWTRHGSLPSALDRLSDTPVRDVTLNDSQSRESYEGRVQTASTFQLCGLFWTDWSPPSVDVLWSHPKGRHCFDLEVREVQRESGPDAHRGGSAVSTPGRASSYGAPVPDDPRNMLVPSANVMSRPFARFVPSFA